jgi:acyl carrier protein
MLAYLADRARHVLGVDESVPLNPHAPLKDAGLDSLMAVELRNLLTRSLGRSLAATLLFDYPSLDVLATHLMGVLGLVDKAPVAAPLTAAPAAPPAPAETPAIPQRATVDTATDAATDIAEISDAEAEALLLAELDRS